MYKELIIIIIIITIIPITPVIINSHKKKNIYTHIYSCIRVKVKYNIIDVCP